MTDLSSRLTQGVFCALPIVLVLLAGCATAPARPADEGLYKWVDQEVAPYLADQLARQPRIKDEPVLLVSMNGADVSPDIDELTRNVRSRLMDHLLQSPGTDLVWRPTVRPWEHHRGRGRLRCVTAGNATVLVGIDISSASGGQYQASVRALDMEAGAWITGFGKSWHGRLSHTQQQAFSERHTDEYLKGLRVLPYYAGETDLAAAYLAQNLSCLLRDQGNTDHRIYVDTESGNDQELRKILTLVAHNLAREQAVDITDDPRQAGLVLGGSLTEVDTSLHQVWLTLNAGPQGVDAARLDTDTYLYLDPSSDALAAMQNHRETVPRRSANQRDSVLSPLSVLAAEVDSGCTFPVRTSTGSKRVIARGECFRVAFDLYRPAQVFVFDHAVDGTLRRLQPVDCRQTDTGNEWLAPRLSVLVPAAGSTAMQWAGRPGIESVYAIAATEPGVARSLAAHLDDLPAACARGRGWIVRAEEQQEWLAELDELMARHPGSIDWQAVRVRHAVTN